MSFCDQIAAAIDGARTLTRLDHLSRSIWQGLAAGAVADDAAQALAERLHAQEPHTRRDQADGYSGGPGLALPTPAAATRSQAPGRDCPTSALGRLWSDAAGPGLQVHGQRAG